MQLHSPRHKTLYKSLQWHFLRLCPFIRPRYQTDTIGYNTACATLERITAPGRHPTHTRYQRHAGRCTVQHSRPIIIRHIRWCSIPQTMQARRGQLLPCVDRWQVLTRCQPYRPGAPAEGSASPSVQGQPGGVSMFPTSGGLQSGTGSAWHPPPGGSIQQQGRGWRRGTIGGSRRISFRAFAR